MKIILLCLLLTLSGCYAIDTKTEEYVVEESKLEVEELKLEVEESREEEYTNYWPFILYLILMFGIYVIGVIERRRNI